MAEKPFITKRKLQSTGSSFVVSIPPTWFENNKINPKKIESLVMVENGNGNLVILNPNGKLMCELAELLKKKGVTLEQLEEIIKKEVTF